MSLRETDALHLASPLMLSVTDAGDFLITDRFYQRVYRYSRSGELLGTLGRQGHGPGEFEMIGAAVLVSDSLVAVLDDSRKSVTLFRLGDQTYVHEIPYEGVGSSFAVATRDTLTFGVFNSKRKTGLAEVVVNDTAVRYYAPVPKVRLEVPALSGIHTLIAHDRGKGLVVVGFSGVDSLFELSPDGTVRAVGLPPAVRRRHLHQAATLIFGRPRPFPELFAATSFLFGVKVLTSGQRAVLHMDQDVEGRFISSRPFLSLLSADSKTGCSDIPVPTSSEARLVPAFHGDSLFFVTQQVKGTSVQTVVEGFAIDPSRCRWREIK